MGNRKLGKYGPGVIGEEEYEKEQAQLDEMGRGENRFGKAITDDWDQNDDISSVHSEDAGEIAQRTATATAEPDEGETTTSQAERAELPPGYTIEGGGGGYWALHGPDGEKIESDKPSGNWGQGIEAVEEAAATHYENSLKQEAVDEEADDAQVSVQELAGIVKKDPGQIDAFLHAEVMRPEGPRLEALRVLLKAEQEKESPRKEALESLEALIADTAHGTEE